MPALSSTLGCRSMVYVGWLLFCAFHLVGLKEEEVGEDFIVDDHHRGVVQVQDHLLGSCNKFSHASLLLPAEAGLKSQHIKISIATHCLPIKGQVEWFQKVGCLLFISAQRQSWHWNGLRRFPFWKALNNLEDFKVMAYRVKLTTAGTATSGDIIPSSKACHSALV